MPCVRSTHPSAPRTTPLRSRGPDPDVPPVKPLRTWRWRSRRATGAKAERTARTLFTARDKPQNVDKRPLNVANRASGARDVRREADPSGSETGAGTTVEAPGAAVRGVPPIRLDEALIDSPAPHRDLSPAQALDLVRRTAEGTSGGDPEQDGGPEPEPDPERGR
jgi:hypothetical protein